MKAKRNFTIDPDDRFYPENPVHEYAIFLGKFTDSRGVNYDLAIFDSGGWIDSFNKYQPDWCDATAHSSEPGDYTSGPMREKEIERIKKSTTREWKVEAYRRATALNIIRTSPQE